MLQKLSYYIVFLNPLLKINELQLAENIDKTDQL
jgi:hypothetical protein